MMRMSFYLLANFVCSCAHIDPPQHTVTVVGSCCKVSIFLLFLSMVKFQNTPVLNEQILYIEEEDALFHHILIFFLLSESAVAGIHY